MWNTLPPPPSHQGVSYFFIDVRGNPPETERQRERNRERERERERVSES